MDANQDLQFVRNVVRQADRTSVPGIALLWAGIILLGALLADVRPAAVGLYWAITAPAGFIVSGVLGYRASQRAGQVSGEQGRRQMLHWGSLLGVGLLAYVLVPVGALTPRNFGSLMLLLAAFTYFQAAIHFDRRIAGVGFSLVAAYLITLFAPAYAWTIAGGLVAMTLIAYAFLTNGAHAENG